MNNPIRLVDPFGLYVVGVIDDVVVTAPPVWKDPEVWEGNDWGDMPGPSNPGGRRNGYPAKRIGEEYYGGGGGNGGGQTVRPSIPQLTAELDAAELLENVNEYIKNATGITDFSIEALKELPDSKLDELHKLSKINDVVEIATIVIDGALMTDAIYYNKPWGKHAYNVATGLMGQWGLHGNLMSFVMGFAPSAFSWLGNGIYEGTQRLGNIIMSQGGY